MVCVEPVTLSRESRMSSEAGQSARCSVLLMGRLKRAAVDALAAFLHACATWQVQVNSLVRRRRSCIDLMEEAWGTG